MMRSRIFIFMLIVFSFFALQAECYGNYYGEPQNLLEAYRNGLYYAGELLKQNKDVIKQGLKSLAFLLGNNKETSRLFNPYEEGFRGFFKKVDRAILGKEGSKRKTFVNKLGQIGNKRFPALANVVRKLTKPYSKYKQFVNEQDRSFKMPLFECARVPYWYCQSAENARNILP
uniref:Secreted protein n=1 Tax=Panagrellus redivivus TaxID=6233 RepID=A0A7E4V8N9_PANRE